MKQKNNSLFYTLLITISAVVIGLVLLSNPAFAQDGEPGGSPCLPGQTSVGGVCQVDNPAPSQVVDIRSFPELLRGVVSILLSVAGAIAVIYLVVGGYQYITSRGNEDAMEKAKKTVTAAIIGIVVIVLAFAIVAILNNVLTQDLPNAGSSGSGAGAFVDKNWLI